MAKPFIVKRNTKGSALTFTELDANFQNLDDATISIAVQGGDTVVNDLNDTTTFIEVDGIDIVANPSAQSISFDASLAKDTSPQLSGDLDIRTYKITTSVTNGNIELDPPGTGKVIISGDLQVDGTTTTINSTTLDVDDKNITLAKGAPNAAAADGGGITLEGPTTPATILYTSTDDSWNFNKITVFEQDVVFEASIKGPPNSPVTIAPDGTGDLHVNADSLRLGDNNSDATINTRGTGDLILTTNEGSAVEGIIRIYDGANGNITLTPNGTGNLVLDGLNWPQSDGAANYVLKTNGLGQLSWTAQTVGTTYTLSAESTSAADCYISLNGSDATADLVRLNSGTGITVEKTDANTITISRQVYTWDSLGALTWDDLG